MPIRAITFDLDDTLWPIAPVIRSAEQQLRTWLASHCPEVLHRYDQAAFLKLRETVARQHPDRTHDLSAMRRLTLAEALRRCGYEPALARDAFAVFFRERNRVNLFPEVSDVLPALASEFRLASLSNGNADLEVIGIASHFHFALSAATVGKPKPHALMFDRACEQFGLAPSQVLHVGDDLALDAVAARDAGLHSVWLQRDDDAGRDVPEGIQQISTLHELRGYIRSQFGV